MCQTRLAAASRGCDLCDGYDDCDLCSAAVLNRDQEPLDRGFDCEESVISVFVHTRLLYNFNEPVNLRGSAGFLLNFQSLVRQRHDVAPRVCGGGGDSDAGGQND